MTECRESNLFVPSKHHVDGIVLLLPSSQAVYQCYLVHNMPVWPCYNNVSFQGVTLTSRTRPSKWQCKARGRIAITVIIHYEE